MKRKSIILVALVGASFPAVGRAADPAALAFINLQHTDSGIEIVGRAFAVTDVHLKGEMTISRNGGAGSVSTRQGGDLILGAGQSGDFARTNVSFQAGDAIEVTVVLSQDGKVISQATLATESHQ
jgi:hypothetical protein